MLEQLFDLVKQYAGKEIIDNPAIPNERNNEATAEATNTVVSGLQNVLAGGGLQNILQLFSGGGQNSQQGNGIMSNPIVNMMAGHFMSKLMKNFGLNSGAASGIASSLIPNVLNGLISKTKDPNDNSFDMNGIIRALTGGNVETAQPAEAGGGGGFDFQDILSKFTGSGGNGGGFNLQDIISKVTGGAQQNQQRQVQSPGGGIMDMLKGLIGG
jgi:hypothetical protein